MLSEKRKITVVEKKHEVIDYGSPDSTGKDFFRYLRLLNNFSQKELALLLKMPKSRVGRIERGEFPINHQLAHKFSIFFNENPSKFYG